MSIRPPRFTGFGFLIGMFVWSLLLLCSVWSADASAEPTVDVSLLPNPGFEKNNGTGAPASWSFTQLAGSSAGSWETGSGAATEGERSVKITNVSPGAVGAWNSVSLAVYGNDLYTYNVLAKTNSVDGQAYVHLVFKNGSAVVSELDSDTILQGTTDWKAITVAAAAPPSATSVTVSLRLAGTGSAWFDWATVEQPVLYNRVSNPGVEVDDGSGNPANWWIAGESGIAQPLNNGGFEASSAGGGWWAAKWSGTSTLTAGIQTSHSGTKSGKVTTTDTASRAGWVNMNNGAYYDVVPGQTYRVSAYIYTAGLGLAADGSAARAELAVLLRDNALSATKEYLAPVVDTSTNGWALRRIDITVPDGWTKLRMDLRLVGAGTVYFDDLSWSKVSWGRDASFADKDGGKAAVAWDGAVRLEGSKSLKVTITDNTYSAGWTSAAIPVRVGDYYTASAMLKTVSAQYGAYLEAEFLDSRDAVITSYTSPVVGGTQDWQLAALEAWAPGGAVRMRVHYKLSGAGTAYADKFDIGQPSYNRAKNPGMEYSAGLYLGVQGRSAYTWAGTGASSVDATVARSGWKSVKSQGSSADAYTGWIAEDVPVEAGKRYNYSVWVKSSSVAGHADLYAIFKNASGTILSSVSLASISGSNDWTQIRNAAYMTPAGAASVRLDFRLTGIGTAWFDDVVIEGPVSDHPSLLFSASDKAALQSKGTTAGEAKTFADALKTISDSVSLTELSDIARNVDPWVTGTLGVGNAFTPVTAPAGAAKVGIEVKVSGKGTAYVDKITMTRVLPQGRSAPVQVYNGSFETGSGWPDGWGAASWTGAGTASWSPVVRSGGGLKSIRVDNPTPASASGIRLDSSRYVQAADGFAAGDQYVYKADIRIDSPGITAVQLIVTYYDIDGHVLRTDTTSGSETVGWRTETNYGMGAAVTGDAATYVVRNDPDYAEKAKRRLIYQLRQMHNWAVRQLNGEDPWNIAAFYSTTRTVDYLAQVYDAIYDAADSGTRVITPAEDAEIRYRFAWLAAQFSNMAYYNIYDPEQKKNNITLDRHAAVAMFGMAFPEYTKAADWYASGINGIKWMMQNVVTEDGAWPESSRYHGGVMRTLLPLVVAMKKTHPNDPASDWFTYTSADPDLTVKTKFKSFVSWFINIQTPRDPVSYYADPITGAASYHNVALTPGVDDANWEPAWFAGLAWAAGQYRDSDPALAGQLMWTWDRGGRMWSMEASPGNALAAFVLIDPTIGLSAPTLTSTSTDFFYHILRDNFNTSNEDYLLFTAGDKHIHGHFGHNGVSLWSKGTPLILDSGVVDYGYSLVQWYRTTAAQNRISLYSDAGARTIKYWGPWGSTVLTPSFSNKLDYVGGDTISSSSDQDVTTAGRRHVFMVKAPFKAYVIWDDMRGILPAYPGAAFWLNAFTNQDISYSGSLATIHGYNNVDLDVKFLDSSVSLSEDNFGDSGFGGDHYADSQKQSKISTQKYIKVPVPVANQELSFATVLYPKNNGEAGLTYTDLTLTSPSDSTKLKAVKVADSSGNYFIILINARSTAETISIPSTDSLTDLKTSNVYASGGGTVTLGMPANSIAILAK